jgi:hypothetical protein
MSSPSATLTVLGVAPSGVAARVAAALGEGEMPPVAVCRAGAIAGFAVQGRAWQHARPVLRAALGRAAALSAFLPADPCQALCDAAAWPGVIAGAAGPLGEALQREGAAQQWEIGIAPEGHHASAAELATRLRAALLPHALAIRLRGVRSGLILKVLMPRAAAHVVADAVATLAAPPARGLAVEGPLPPLGFAAFRLERAESEAVSRAWAMLALRDAADSAELARRWRGLAFALDPARGGRRLRERPLREARQAYGLLRSLSGGLGGRRFRRDELLALCGSTVAVPAVPRVSPKPCATVLA